MKCCPDTGATQTVVCEQIAHQASLSIFPPRIGMVSLTGHGLNIIGESNVCLSYEGLRHETAVWIAFDLSGDSMLVAWHDLKPLEVIMPNFPARNSVAMSKELTTGIMQEFPTFFRDKLGELPMNVPKMKIVLAENAVPYRISTSRQVSFKGLRKKLSKISSD